MYKEYIINGKELLVTDDEGNVKKFPNNDNSLKKIKLENDLEKLSEMIFKCKKDITTNKIRAKIDLAEGIFGLLVGGPLSIGNLVILFSNGMNILTLLSLLISLGITGGGVLTIFESISLKRDNKAISMELDYIEKEFDKVQKELLEVQKTIEKEEVLENDINKGIEGSINKIEESSNMMAINNDLNLIWLYQNKKKEILKNYRDGSLVSYMNSLGYNLIDFYFMESIIQKDLGLNEEKGKRLVKK